MGSVLFRFIGAIFLIAALLERDLLREVPSKVAIGADGRLQSMGREGMMRPLWINKIGLEDER
jgi:hypothetical protein